MITIPNLREGYKELVKYVQDNGDRVAPRGFPTTEVRAAVIKVLDPTDTLPLIENRKPNLAIGAAEAVQLIGGFSDPEGMLKVAPQFKNYMNDGKLHGAYGPRVGWQWNEIEESIRKDHDTRQSIALIWQPSRDLNVKKNDLPCTLGFQFFVRNEQLEMHAMMRSNDIYWGLCYDAFQFTQLQITMARAVGLQVGPFTHFAGSLHLYDRDLEAIANLGDPQPEQHIFGIGKGMGEGMRAAQQRAHEIWKGTLSDPTDSEQWFMDTLGPKLREAEIERAGTG